MTLSDRIRKALGRKPDSPSEVAGDRELPTTSRADSELFVYIMIPESILPLERGEKYEDPIDRCLTPARLGYVSGGGSQLGEETPDGARTIAFCGIDVEVTDLRQALALLRGELQALSAPDGTELHYTQAEVKLRDTLRGNTWIVAQPRDFLHPAFRC